jgi:hypothetical protein
MIGVIVDPADHLVVREFFELFKTPWEFYSSDRKYDAVLCAGDFEAAGAAHVVIRYAGRNISFDDDAKIRPARKQRNSCELTYGNFLIPIYGSAVGFGKPDSGFLTFKDSSQCAAYHSSDRESAIVRVGYDLFGEVRHLLTVGQPAENAATPTLDLHIKILRDIITGCGVSLVEIPPIPAGYGCIACLTHDVDHPSIRQHRWDHTMLGFLYRAIFGSAKNFVRGRIFARDLFANWAAALKLPFVYLGMAKDFWRDFDDSYLTMEKGVHSTFFVVPFKNRPGKKANGPAPPIRAARYGAQDIADSIEKLEAAGCEIGLHGIDAWIDVSKGREELEEIRRLNRASQVGVRMHWLYSDQNSPARLEAAGAAYDSTSGYNETVGYRAGTTQVFKPFNTNQMLELPLHAMDTALFYPAYLGLSERDASNRLGQLVDNAFQFGGMITVNWHDRSLAPERLWGGCYRSLIQDLKSRGAWFARAGQAISWFQKRRSAIIEINQSESGGGRALLSSNCDDSLPGLQLRVHKGRTTIAPEGHSSDEYTDTPLNRFVATKVSSEAAK